MRYNNDPMNEDQNTPVAAESVEQAAPEAVEAKPEEADTETAPDFSAGEAKPEADKAAETPEGEPSVEV
jgi:hypothetical protein